MVSQLKELFSHSDTQEYPQQEKLRVKVSDGVIWKLIANLDLTHYPNLFVRETKAIGSYPMRKMFWKVGLRLSE